MEVDAEIKLTALPLIYAPIDALADLSRLSEICGYSVKTIMLASILNLS
jgi:hypothetical protein